jgi:secernin
VCDTLVVTPQASADGVTLLAKNSDRDPNEAQFLQLVPAAAHGPGSTLHCTYIEIPQARETHAVLLSRPFWLWGAQMGVNEHGVAIGNEAVFSRVPAQKEPALLGMDLLRLGLERGVTAHEALQVIVELLMRYGQGGNAAHGRTLYHHNSYLIADPQEAWVLETVNRQWVAKRVEDSYALSNDLTLGTTWDDCSPDLAQYAIAEGWCDSLDDFDMARYYADRIYTPLSACRERRARSLMHLEAGGHYLAVGDLLAALRDHGGEERDYRPDRGLTGATACMHAGFGPLRSSQTTASMVARLTAEGPTLLVTGTAAPCTSLYKPLWLDAGLPDLGPEPTDRYDSATLFWRHERLHRATLSDYVTRMAHYAPERDALEGQFVAQTLQAEGASLAERLALTERCFAEADAAETRWLQALSGLKRRTVPRPLCALAWRDRNRRAGMPALP